MSVIAGNVVVALSYTGLLAGSLLALKLAAGHPPEVKPNIRCFSTSGSPYLTLWKYLAWRYTLLAVGLRDKQYLLVQLMSLILYITALLRINAVTYWAIGLAPIGLVAGTFMNEYWRMGRSNDKQEEHKSIATPEEKEVCTPEAITRIVAAGLTSVMLAGSISRIAQSVSNIGELNVLSALVCLAAEQLAVRPFLFLTFLAGVKILETKSGRSSLQSNTLICHMLVSEYLRNNLQQRIIPESSSSPPKRQELSPSRVPKVSASSRFDETNSLFDMLKQRTSERTQKIENLHLQKSQKLEKDLQAVHNICLDDRNIFQQRNQTDENDTEKSEKPKKSEVSEQFLCLDLNKENLAATVKRESKDRRNEDHDDLYLAQNFYPAKHQQTLPITITLSPIRQRKPTRSKHKRPNRVLVLTGDSPYLQYLPNMLKKQESQNKLRQGKDKQQPLHARSDFLNGGLKEIPR